LVGVPGIRRLAAALGGFGHAATCSPPDFFVFRRGS